MTTAPLPRLLDRKQISAELNVKLATAERIMRGCPLITIGRRVYVTDQSVADFLKNEARTSGGTS